MHCGIRAGAGTLKYDFPHGPEGIEESHTDDEDPYEDRDAMADAELVPQMHLDSSPSTVGRPRQLLNPLLEAAAEGR